MSLEGFRYRLSLFHRVYSLPKATFEFVQLLPKFKYNKYRDVIVLPYHSIVYVIDCMDRKYQMAFNHALESSQDENQSKGTFSSFYVSALLNFCFIKFLKT